MVEGVVTIEVAGVSGFAAAVVVVVAGFAEAVVAGVGVALASFYYKVECFKI